MKSFASAGLLLACLGLACAGEIAPEEGGGVQDVADAAAGDTAPTADAAAPPSDAGARGASDAGPDQAAPPSAPNAPRCGPAPYQLVKLGARNQMAPASQRNLAGVRITLEACPEVAVLTDADGKALVNVTKDVTTWIRFDAPGFVPWLCGEMKASAELGAQELVASMLSD